MKSALTDGLPVAGYRPQPARALELVNANKLVEERVLRILDELAAMPDLDKRWLAIGRTEIERGFMAINRAIFQPSRVEIPDGQARVWEQTGSDFK